MGDFRRRGGWLDCDDDSPSQNKAFLLPVDFSTFFNPSSSTAFLFVWKKLMQNPRHFLKRKDEGSESHAFSV